MTASCHSYLDACPTAAEARPTHLVARNNNKPFSTDLPACSIVSSLLITFTSFQR